MGALRLNPGVVVVAQVASEAQRPEIEARLGDLRSFYRPLGPVAAHLGWHPELRLVAAALDLQGDEQRGGATDSGGGALWTWGERLPAALEEPRALIEAGPAALAAIQGTSAAFAFTPASARIVTAPSGPATLYRADGAGVRVWATHAVAAAWAASGDARVDPGAVPELLAYDFVGGTRTLIDGVTVTPPAADIRFGGEMPGEGTWLGPAERWQPVPEDEAAGHAERALLEALDARARTPGLALALTGGLDSRVMAIALTTAGIPFEAFTWGDPGWPDPVGAASVARSLELPRHVILAQDAPPDTEVLAEHDRAVRWTDGVFALAATRRTWPTEVRAIAGGMGGETGRAFYADEWTAWLWPDGPRAALAGRLAARGHLPWAGQDAVAEADAAVAAWLDAAEQSGLEGWRLLDVVYADQRVRRWGRGQMPYAGVEMIPGFTPQAIARALVSQTLGRRLGSAFHHDFVERHRPELAMARPRPRDLPSSALRAVHRRRDARHRARSLGQPRPENGDSYLESLWAERPETRDWVLEHAVPHALTGERLGAEWVAWARDGFPRGARRAGEQACLAAAVVALDDALRQARRSSGRAR